MILSEKRVLKFQSDIITRLEFLFRSLKTATATSNVTSFLVEYEISLDSVHVKKQYFFVRTRL